MASFMFLLLFAVDSSSLAREAVVSPQDPVLPVGSSLRATCSLGPELGLHASSLFWTLNGARLPGSAYSVVSSSVLSVGLRHLAGSQQTSGDNLMCHAADGHVLAGSCLFVGLPPEKPLNLTCVSHNAKDLSCEWEVAETHIPTTYTLKYKLRWHGAENECESSRRATQKHSCRISGGIAIFTPYEIWVEATNQLGSASSDVSCLDILDVVTTDPPANVQARRLGDLEEQLMVLWASPPELKEILFRARYQIRYRPEEGLRWKVTDDAGNLTSCRLEGLQPGTVYFVQVRCQPVGILGSRKPGIWSDWSHPTAASTPRKGVQQSCGCDPETAEQNSQPELKQFSSRAPKHGSGCGPVAPMLRPRWRAWLQRAHKKQVGHFQLQLRQMALQHNDS